MESKLLKRYFDEKERTSREHKKHLRFIHKWPVKVVTCICDLQAGRFRKFKGKSCGAGRGGKKCHMCHYYKINRTPRKIDYVKYSRYRQGLEDYFDESGVALTRRCFMRVKRRLRR